jgi:ABC-2 type transport system ATP-binding protein
MDAIEVRGLRKSYGGFEAVRGIDFSVASGECFGLIGPNGAGKTTTVEILEGHRKRTAGDVSVLGFDPGRPALELKRRIGIVLQSPSVEPYLTVAETIDLFRGYYPAPRPLDEIVDVVGLDEQRNQRVRSLSGGQQRRLDVAIGLAGDPELLFLDEPTTGFDPGARRNAWGMIRNLKSLGKTILLTTHYMDEAQNLADRVAIIVGGEIVAEGPPSTLIGREAAATIIRFRPPAVRLPSEFAKQATEADGFVEIRTQQPTKTLHKLTAWAIRRRIELDELVVARPTLEDVYLQLTGPGSE